MTPDEMRRLGEGRNDCGSHHASDIWLATAEICARLDALLAAVEEKGGEK